MITMDNNYYDVLVRFHNEIKVMIYTSFVFLNIKEDVVHILLLLMFLDTFFGVVKAIVANERVTIKKLLLGLTIKFLILLIPMMLALVGKGLSIYDFTPLVEIVFRILIVGEGFSIITSMYIIKTGKKVEDVDIVSLMLATLRKVLLSMINMLLKKIDTAMSDKEET